MSANLTRFGPIRTEPGRFVHPTHILGPFRRLLRSYVHGVHTVGVGDCRDTQSVAIRAHGSNVIETKGTLFDGRAGADSSGRGGLAGGC